MLLYTAFINSAFAFLIVFSVLGWKQASRAISSAKLHLLCVLHPDYLHCHDEGHAAEHH